MRAAPRQRATGPARQRGLAMIVLATLIAMLSAYLVAKSISRTSTQVAVERDKRTMEVLKEAKAALINYAASQILQLDNFQPGSLPCPDRNDDGDAEGLCSSASARIGRFPWKSVGAGDLRDGSGERLWYAISSNFRHLSGTTVINSDTQGQLTITGSTPASNVIAVIVSPGAALQGQDRDPTDSTKWNDQTNFLEGANAGTNDDVFATTSTVSDTFNDRLITITSADLFAVVEPAVASLINAYSETGGSSIKDYINQYRATWGRYPYPATFADPGSSDYKGTVSATSGLLPVTTDPSFLTWRTGSPAPSLSKTGGTGSVDSIDCGSSTSTRVTCQFEYDSGAPIVTITATANNAGRALVRGFDISDLTIERYSTLFGWISYTGSSISASAYTLAANATGAASLSVQMRSRSSTAIIRIRIPVPPYHAITTTTDPYAGWFISNQWYKQVYYVVSSSWVPGGNGVCTPVPATSNQCLTVNNWPTSPTNNKGALVILAGRALNGTSRPSSTLSEYLEGENIASETYTDPFIGTYSGNWVYQTQLGISTAANDRAVVLYP